MTLSRQLGTILDRHGYGNDAKALLMAADLVDGIERYTWDSGCEDIITLSNRLDEAARDLREAAGEIEP